jgi:hypothetical protein
MQMPCDLLDLKPNAPVLVLLELKVLVSASDAQDSLERTVVVGSEVPERPALQEDVDQERPAFEFAVAEDQERPLVEPFVSVLLEPYSFALVQKRRVPYSFGLVQELREPYLQEL